MKRFLTLILALCLILSLTACGETGLKPITTEAPAKTEPAKTEPAKTEPAKTEPAKTEPATTEPAGTEPATTEPAGTEPAGTEAPDNAEIRGVVKDGAYENKLLGIRVARPTGWIFYDEQQIAQVNNITAELLGGSDIAELIGKNGQFMDLMLANLTGNNINLIIQPKQALLDSYSDMQIFTLSEQTFKAQFQSANMEVSTYEPITMQVGGEERTVLHIIVSASGVEMDEYQIWFRNASDYMGVLTLAIQDGSDPQPILDGITTLN